MTLGELKRRLALVVQDTSLEPEFDRMINDAILEIAADFDLPALRLLNPHPVSVTTADWLWPLPEKYHKNLFRCLDASGERVKVLHRLEDLEALDLKHEDEDEYVTHVAVMDTGVDNFLCIYPKAVDTLKLWFYERPNYLEKSGDTCRCIPLEFQERVIIPKAIIKNYQLLQDQVQNFDLKPLQYWEGKLREGLFGSPNSIGLFNFITKAQGGPRRRGGRDPIGARGY